MRVFSFFCSALLLTLTMMNGYAAQRQLHIRSIEELVACAAMDNVHVTMQSGIYHIDDTAMAVIVPLKVYGNNTTGEVQAPKDRPATTYLHFSGNNSTYNLEGVVIKLSGILHSLATTLDLFELFVTGNNNTIRGLSIEDEDESIAPTGGGAVMVHVMGDENTLDGLYLLTRGSTPYGYGHLLGKGSPAGYARLNKHSVLLISGRNTKILNSHLETHAFGHGLFMQGAVNTHIENCLIEGRLRSTDEMLSETSGVAYDAGFKSIYPPGVFEANRMIALSEDGVRTYPFGGYVNRLTQGVTVINTTVKRMRSGFDVSVNTPPTVIVGCEAIECQEKGYSVGSQSVVVNSRGDAKYGPLLTFQRTDVENAYVDLELTSAVSDYKVTRLAEISGSGHYIRLRNYSEEGCQRELPIVFGETFWSDVHRFRFPDQDPANFSGAYNVTLVNETGMPAEFAELSGGCLLYTNGQVDQIGTVEQGNRVVKN